MHVPAATPPGTVTERANPLRDPSDRRLPRVPEPCALVVFGVTGDLARKKLMPAIYDLANRGLLPADFALLGFARRDWGDGDFAAVAKKAAKEHARTAVERRRLAPAQREPPVRARVVRRRRRVRHAGRDTGQPAQHARDQRQRGVLPVDPAGDVPGRAQADGAHRDGQQRAQWRLAARRGREAVRPRSGQRPEAQRTRRQRLHRERRVPHRPLPGQGDRPEPDGAAVRQPAVRADLELALCRLGADHHGRGRRHRRPGRVLRRDRRRARRAAEPPLPTARAHRDGGAGRVLGRGDPYREDQGAPSGEPAARSRRLRDPRSVRPRLARR